MLSPSYLQAEQAPLSWIWYMLLAVLVLLLIFWWINRRRDDVPDEKSHTHVETKRKQAPDDLQRIEGIGPKVEQVLHGAGITTFESLARSKPAEVKQVLNGAGLQMMNPEGWIEQAELAAKGDWGKLERLQGELKAGRKQ